MIILLLYLWDKLLYPLTLITQIEVHHHPHVEKKSFKEYLLEGLMIFLAVAMGFFAENIREHLAEQEKGKQYINSFYQDLKYDTSHLTKLINE